MSTDGEIRLTNYRDEVVRLKSALDAAYGPEIKNNTKAPEDVVVFPLGVAIRDMCEEVLWLGDQGFGIAALRTSRTIYESAVFSLYINKHPETWKTYLHKMFDQWACVLRNVPDASHGLSEMHRAISEHVVEYSQGRKISLNWNDDRTTFRMARDVGISDLFHSLAFNYTSGFVHPSAIFFLSNFTKSLVDGVLHVGEKKQDNELKMALRITHDMTINAIRLRLKYSDSLVLRETLKLCEKDFVNVWGYHPQLTDQNTS